MLIIMIITTMMAIMMMLHRKKYLRCSWEKIFVDQDGEAVGRTESRDEWAR